MPAPAAATNASVESQRPAPSPPATRPGPIAQDTAQPRDASVKPRTRPVSAAVLMAARLPIRAAAYPQLAYSIQDPRVAQTYEIPVMREATDARASKVTTARAPIAVTRVEVVICGSDSHLTSFKKFYTVSERIEHIDTVESLEGLVRHRREPSGLAARRQFRQPAHQNGRVCLASWPEVRVYPEMELERAAEEPRATTRCKIRRFCHLDQAQDIRVEGPCNGLLPSWHCELNVIDQVIAVSQTTIVRGAWTESRELSVHGWIYAVGDGRLRDLNVTIGSSAEDFGWVTRKLMDVADTSAGGKVVSILEGGYDLQGLKESVAEHVTALMAG